MFSSQVGQSVWKFFEQKETSAQNYPHWRWTNQTSKECWQKTSCQKICNQTRPYKRPQEFVDQQGQQNREEHAENTRDNMNKE